MKCKKLGRQGITKYILSYRCSAHEASEASFFNEICGSFASLIFFYTTHDKSWRTYVEKDEAAWNWKPLESLEMSSTYIIKLGEPCLTNVFTSPYSLNFFTGMNKHEKCAHKSKLVPYSQNTSYSNSWNANIPHVLFVQIRDRLSSVILMVWRPSPKSYTVTKFPICQSTFLKPCDLFS